jgi:monovalent cation/hydrogen antiporter
LTAVPRIKPTSIRCRSARQLNPRADDPLSDAEILFKGPGPPHHAADERERRDELIVRSEALKIAQRRLQQLAADRETSPEVVAILRARHAYRGVRYPDRSSNEFDATFAAAELRSELIAAEREYIYRLLQDGQIADEARRRIERELDLEEAGIAEFPL